MGHVGTCGQDASPSLMGRCNCQDSVPCPTKVRPSSRRISRARPSPSEVATQDHGQLDMQRNCTCVAHNAQSDLVAQPRANPHLAALVGAHRLRSAGHVHRERAGMSLRAVASGIRLRTLAEPIHMLALDDEHRYTRLGIQLVVFTLARKKTTVACTRSAHRHHSPRSLRLIPRVRRGSVGRPQMPSEPTTWFKSKDHCLDEHPLGGGRCQRSERHMIEQLAARHEHPLPVRS